MQKGSIVYGLPLLDVQKKALQMQSQHILIIMGLYFKKVNWGKGKPPINAILYQLYQFLFLLFPL